VESSAGIKAINQSLEMWPYASAHTVK